MTAGRAAAGDGPCRRCGTCCRKGGPALHGEDRPLVVQGHLPARSLFTLRRGEMARDDVRGTLQPLDQEIIKIKGQGGGWTCLFFQEAAQACGIYAHRPVECRVLDCRDTRRIEGLYRVDRLERRDLLAEIEGLWALIEEHERHCSYERLAGLVAEGQAGAAPQREAEILELLRFDFHIRRLTVERGQLDAALLDFVFGRALADTLAMFGLRLVRRNGVYGLVSAVAGAAPAAIS